MNDPKKPLTNRNEPAPAPVNRVLPEYAPVTAQQIREFLDAVKEAKKLCNEGECK